jgi:D-beta-D-heptose 7-phosphate kinase/D-beta-D-heptose 1-phosphate adenosyltransferase
LKVAILIFGEYRTFESVVRSWNCRHWDNVDYYMSTWDYSLEPVERQRFILDWKDEKWANEDFIKKTLPGVNLKIHNSNSKDYQTKHDTNKMVFHWKILYQMVIESDKKYDYIFLIRTDSLFFIEESFFKTTEPEILYLDDITEEGIHDIFFFGWGDVILEFIKNCPENINNPHLELKEYIDTKLKYKYVGTNEKSIKGRHYRLIRSNMQHLFDSIDPNHPEDKVFSKDFSEELRNQEKMYMNSTDECTLLIGESCTDEFVYGDVERLTPDAPVPVFKSKKTISNDGMAANVKNQLNEFINPPNHFITNENEVIKKRFIDETSNYILLRHDIGDDDIKRFDIKNLPDDVFEVIVFSDYNKGFLLSEDIEYIVNFYRDKIKKFNEENGFKRKLVIFIDTKRKLGDWVKNIDFIKLNYKEYLNNKDYIDNNSWLKEKVIITRGEHGCIYNNKVYKTNKVNVKDVSGAGDIFLASLVTKYKHTNNIESSIEFGNFVSELVVQKKGVETISPFEINNHREKINKLNNL